VPLTLEQVSYSYGSHDVLSPAVREVSLTLADGEFLGIIGHTGSGKSTLLQLMCGLLQPSQGRVLIDGEDLSSKAVRRMAHTKVGMAFQYPEYQLFAPTVADDIAFGPRNARLGKRRLKQIASKSRSGSHPDQRDQRATRLSSHPQSAAASLSTDEIDCRVREAMATLGLDYDHYAQRSPFELSGGEKRRVALAGVLASDPKVLILDEPTAGLDPAGRDRLMRTIGDIRASGKTIVMVSHSMEDIARHATQVLVLNQGEIFDHGTPQAVFSHPVELRAINLGVPQTTAFAADLNERGFDLPLDLYSIDALAEAIVQQLNGELISTLATTRGGDSLAK
jgi:energy-coupling factor transport system ATP-binding protein